MRFLFGIFGVSALGLILLIGCGEEGPAACNDGNACTWDYRHYRGGPCSYEPWPDGSPCVAGGVTGVCVAGECEEDLCRDVVCDDGDPCTEQECNYSTGNCYVVRYIDSCLEWNAANL